MAAQIASAQTGPIVITKGRIVSLLEWELRSKAKKTRTVPYSRMARASETPATLVHFMSGQRLSEATSYGISGVRNGVVIGTKALFGFHIYGTSESIALAGELIKVVNGAHAAA